MKESAWFMIEGHNSSCNVTWVTNSLVWVHGRTSKALCITVDPEGLDNASLDYTIEVTLHCKSDWVDRGERQ